MTIFVNFTEIREEVDFKSRGSAIFPDFYVLFKWFYDTPQKISFSKYGPFFLKKNHISITINKAFINTENSWEYLSRQLKHYLRL